jgi:fructokinase
MFSFQPKGASLGFDRFSENTESRAQPKFREGRLTWANCTFTDLGSENMSSKEIEITDKIRPAIMVGLGEILWDLLPSGKQLGGAPANFAYMVKVLGDEGIVASRTGSDDLGHEARKTMKTLGLNPSFLQSDEKHSTGVVKVLIDGAGQPEFTIASDVSWDHLEWTTAWEGLAARADAICFGSLAQRSEESRGTVHRFLEASKENALRIYDVNLREPFYSKDIIIDSLRLANIAKLNADELVKVCGLLNIPGQNEQEMSQRLLTRFDLKLVCITRGTAGSLLLSPDQIVEHGGFKVAVADAIGAGDAFTACLAHHYIRGQSLHTISELANGFASWVATQTGATPTVPLQGLQSVLDEITQQQVRTSRLRAPYVDKY